MLPTLADGDRVLLVYGRPRRAGRVVVVRFPDALLAIKRATVRDGDGWWVERDNPLEGVDSAQVGTIPDHDVLAVAVARLWPRPRLLRRH